MKIIKKYSKIIKYGMFSVLSLIVDTTVFVILFNYVDMSLIVSNTTAMCIGFVVQFVLASKRVFGVDINVKTLAVYVLTTLIGFAIANITIYISFFYVFENKDLVSKFASVVVPFFVMYFLRKYIFNKWFINNYSS